MGRVCVIFFYPWYFPFMTPTRIQPWLSQIPSETNHEVLAGFRVFPRPPVPFTTFTPKVTPAVQIPSTSSNSRDNYLSSKVQGCSCQVFKAMRCNKQPNPSTALRDLTDDRWTERYFHSHVLWFIIRESNPSLLELGGFQTPCFLSNSWGQSIGGNMESDTHITLM